MSDHFSAFCLLSCDRLSLAGDSGKQLLDRKVRFPRQSLGRRAPFAQMHLVFGALADFGEMHRRFVLAILSFALLALGLFFISPGSGFNGFFVINRNMPSILVP